MRAAAALVTAALLTPAIAVSAQQSRLGATNAQVQTARPLFSGGRSYGVNPAPSLTPLERMGVGGAIGGVIGWGAGALVGYQIAGRDCTGQDCDLESILLGGAVGGTLGMAIGVHVGNRRRGNFALDFLSAAAVWGAGIGLVFLLEEFKEDATTKEQEDLLVGQAVVLLAIPVVQLVATSLVEQMTGRSSGRRQRTALVVIPMGDGGLGLGTRVRF